MIFERSNYLYDKKYPTDIFTALRSSISDRVQELDEHARSYSWEFNKLSDDLDKLFPPGDPEDLFLYGNYVGDIFLGDKLNSIGKILLYYNTLITRIRKFAKTAILVLAIFWAWRQLSS